MSNEEPEGPESPDNPDEDIWGEEEPEEEAWP